MADIVNVAVDGEIIQAVNVRKIMARSGFVALRKNEPGMEIMLLNVWQTVILAKQTVFILNVKRKEEHLVVQVVILMVVDIMFAHIDVLFRKSIFLFDILLNIYIKKSPVLTGLFARWLVLGHLWLRLSERHPSHRFEPYPVCRRRLEHLQKAQQL